MSRRVVKAPDGRRWTVRRRWAPRLGQESLFGRFRRRIKSTIHRGGDLADADPGCAADLGDELAVAAIVIIVVLLAVFVVVPLLVAIIDLLVLLLLAALTVVGRVVFRRPWTVEARADDSAVRTWKVVGWRASEARRDEIAQLMAAGIEPPDDSAAAPRPRAGHA